MKDNCDRPRIKGLPHPIVFDAEYNLVDCLNPPAEAYATACENLLAAEAWYAKLGVDGIDGKGAPARLIVDLECGENGGMSEPTTLHVALCELESARGDARYRRAMLHEVTHMVNTAYGERGALNGSVRKWRYGDEGAAIEEGLAQLSEWENSAGSGATYPGPFEVSMLHSWDVDDGEPHHDGVRVMRAGAYMALGLAAREGKVNLLKLPTDPSLYDWEGEGRLRVVATKYVGNHLGADRTLTLDGLKLAYEDAARELDIPIEIVDGAFERVK